MQDKSTFMKMREDEREVRKTLIINAAIKLFEERSFHDIGMRDIAEEAGVSAASIYRYFPSRDDLFAEALIRDIIIVEQRFERQIEEKRLDIVEFATSTVDYLMDNEATYQMMTHFMIRGKMESDVLARFNTVQRYFMDLLDRVLLSEFSSDEIRLYSHTFYSSLAGIVMTFRNYPGRDKEDARKHMHRLAKIVANVFRDGMKGK